MQLLAVHAATGLQASGTRQEVVHAQAHSVIGLLDGPLGGQGNAKGLGQERSLINPVLPFREGLPNQLQLGRVELFESELEVANTAMQQLRAARTGALAGITRLEQRHPQSTTHRFVGKSGTTAAAANDQQIKAIHHHASANNGQRPGPSGGTNAPVPKRRAGD